MINQDKWINSLPKANDNIEGIINQINNDRWTKTIAKKNKYNSVKRYSFMSIIFIIGLLFVSVVKNETRNLQKEINNLKASTSIISFNLNQANLDNQVITSPENISLLAKEYLNIDLSFYKHNQIESLNNIDKNSLKLNNNKEKINKLPANIKAKVKKKIEEKKSEIKKLQKIYSDPKSIPSEIRTQVAIKINKKKNKIKNI